MLDKIEIRRSVSAEDLRHILSKPRDIEAAVSDSHEKFLHIVSTYPTKGGTLLVNGEPRVAGGVTVNAAAGYANVWLVAQPGIGKYAVQVAREVKRHVDAARAAGLPLRTTVAPGNKSTERFIKFLGFEKAPNKDYWEFT